jgi:hypothetical protein
VNIIQKEQHIVSAKISSIDTFGSAIVQFSEEMNLFERFINSIYLMGTKIIYKFFAITQMSVIKEFGYDYELDPFPKDSMYLNQCVNGRRI